MLSANTPAQAKSLPHSPQQAARCIGLYVNSDKIEFIRFNQNNVISSLNGKLLKFIDLFMYRGSNISSTLNIRIGKAWTAVDRLLNIWKWHSPMDSYTWTHQCWPTSKSIYSSALYGNGMLSCQERWLIKTDGEIERESSKSVMSTRLDDHNDIFRNYSWFLFEVRIITDYKSTPSLPLLPAPLWLGEVDLFRSYSRSTWSVWKLSIFDRTVCKKNLQKQWHKKY